MSPEEAVELAQRCYLDPALFCRTFLGHWFTKPMPWVHRGMLALRTRQVEFLTHFGKEYWPEGEYTWDEAGLDKLRKHFVRLEDPGDPGSRKIPLFEYVDGKLTLLVGSHLLFILPRGISKTTLMNAMNIRDINYKDLSFLVYVSEAAPHSQKQLNNLKREMETNVLLHTIFGYKVPDRNSPERWAHDEIETTDGVVVMARGRGGQVRGMLAKNVRPDHVVFDDLEDSDSVRTEDQIKKTKDWFKADLEPILPRIGKSGRITGLATILSPNALVVALSQDPEYVTVRLGAMDPDGEPLWSEYMTRESYDRTKLSYQRMGALQKFHMEYDSATDVVPEEATFKSHYIRTNSRDRKDFVGVALAVDPAISESKSASYWSAAVVGIDGRGRLHVFESFCKIGMSPREQVDKYFELFLRYDCTAAGIESIAYQTALIHLVREEMFRKAKDLGGRVYHEVVPIKHGNADKSMRIKGILAPRYAAGYITHDRTFPILETQLLEFDLPESKKDAPDAVAMAITLLDPYAALAFDDGSEDVDKLAKNTMQPLARRRGCP